ncbi:peptidylprolyl isomerase [Ottowia sp.]|uniref:peptidylprolyl isomerase n=1 Tax=Ottowia sp. TaxID=1898956 RepID=UPI002C089CF6|nr:peptidylprolyl isomerase [Ottowia sp.]HPZ55695.1 peptidylprolyl isomerase [Ottowia sp.]HQD46312.1 peptidylprolyl isomerase [Ottowia sp.]
MSRVPFRLAHARWLVLSAACAALALPAQAQTDGTAAAAAPRAKPAARKPPARKASPKAARQAVPAAAPAATPAAAPAPATPPARSAASAGPREADYIVAVVNTEPVTNNEVRARMARAQRQLAERAMSVPAGVDLRTDMLERLIAERAQLQYAREIGLKVDDAALAQAELSIARQNQLATVQELHARIQQDGIALKDFRDDVRNQVLLARLRQQEIEPKLRVTDAEVDAFIREQTGARAGAVDLNLAMILVAVPEGANAADQTRLQARADEAARRARGGEDFAKLATEYSDANNRGRDGGVLGLRPIEQYPELFQRSVQRARMGDVVGPVKSDAGFHVLKVLERKQNNDLPEVKIPQTHVRHILLRTGPAQGERVARERAADIKRRVASGQASFEQLAREMSQDESAQDGGELGWVPPGQFVPEFEQAMNNLNPGEVSDPVVTRFGVHLIRVDGRREQVLTAAEQRQLARNMLREKKAQEAFETWAREVRGRAYVEYRDPPR